MKRFYKPMLAKSAKGPFNSKDWIFEVKWDGIRAISYINDEISMRSRNNKELKGNFQEFEELRDLTRNTVLDGEIVVMKNGKADFQSLMERSQSHSIFEERLMKSQSPAVYIVFDILEKDDKPLINLSLIERKKLLEESLKEGKYVIFSRFIEEDGIIYYQSAVDNGVEGVMAKKKDSQYEPGVRSRNWLKIKKLETCDCVICGYTEGTGSRKDLFGALVLGLYNNSKLVFVGKVGSGFSNKEMQSLIVIFKQMQNSKATLQEVDIPEKVFWLTPELVCEVSYQLVTKDGKLRMPIYKHLRTDKNADECTINQLPHN